jgi:quinol monooxygenase YgiN
MHALIVHFDVLPNRLDDFDRLVEQTLASIATHEPRTRVYLAGSPVEGRGERIFIEVYQDAEAFAEHEAQPYVRAFLARRGPMLRSVTVDVLPHAEGVLR